MYMPQTRAVHADLLVRSQHKLERFVRKGMVFNYCFVLNTHFVSFCLDVTSPFFSVLTKKEMFGAGL